MNRKSKISKCLRSILLIMMATFTLASFGGATKASAETRDVWMQTIYKENGTIVVYFKLNVSEQQYTGGNGGYIDVKNTSTGVITRYNATEVPTDESGIQLFKATYTPKNGENVRIRILATKPSLTGKVHDYYDDNNGY